ncbi:MAG TPA: glycosyltransferase family 1 protein, partial [Candidatus Brocadiia bacterium]|nr:glycosyltransferase family 1 protein [Candidatus Brocadiia bacterium]
LPIPLRPAPQLSDGDLRAAAARLRLPPRFILYAGNIEPKKNVATLIRAYAHMRRNGATDHPLVLAGRWAWKCGDVEQAIRQENVGQHILRLGYVSDADLGALMRLAGLFVFPSIEEGCGLPPLEAMAAGVPVVASTAASLPEVLGDAALLVPPLDAPQLAAAMTKVLNNTFLRGALIQRGKRRVAELAACPHASKLREICGMAAHKQ